jgi:2-iminobutanoate/2-iminopropanoate deaminase
VFHYFWPNIIPTLVSQYYKLAKSYPIFKFMDKVSFNSSKVPRGNLVIPQAVIAGGFIFVSGTTGVNPETGKLISNNYGEQAAQAFVNIKTILEDAGSNMDKVVKTTVFMVAGEDPDFSIINKVYSELFSVNPPARSAPQVMPFPGGILVSVECIALV